MIICALDYKKTKYPLSCTVDGDNMTELAKLCNAKIEKLYNEDATVENVSKLVKQVGSRCSAGDYFVFYYAGHGANLPDRDGDEEDGQDEAFCFVDRKGQTSPACWLRDDDFATLVTSSVHADTNILILSDCCHSGTVADLNKSIWNGFSAISISGCKDQQTSGDTGKGGIFTHALLLALDGLMARGASMSTVGEVYHETLSVDDAVFASAQDITIQAKPSDKMLWPLVPPASYTAPMRRTAHAAAAPHSAEPTHSAAPAAKVAADMAASPAGSPGAAKPPAVHLIVCALDYAKTNYPLTCSMDGNNMLELAKLCNAEVHKLYNEEATVANVGSLVKEVGSRCGAGDYFVFFYAGHGANLPDQDGDEADGKDEAFCLVDAKGQTSPECWLRDDDFARLVTSSVHAETNVLVLADCCHSGTVADLSKSIWSGYNAISISGCKDQQTSGDTGRGGIFTHSMLLALGALRGRGRGGFTVGELYKETVDVDNRIFASAQDITIQSARGDDRGMAWPLVPPPDYVAPMERAGRELPSSLPKAQSPAPAPALVPAQAQAPLREPQPQPKPDAPTLPTLLKSEVSAGKVDPSPVPSDDPRRMRGMGQRGLAGAAPDVVSSKGGCCFWKRPQTIAQPPPRRHR